MGLMVLEKNIFSHYEPSMGGIYGHGGHLDLRTVTICINVQAPFNTRLHMKFEEISSKGFRGEVVRMCKRTYLRRTMDNGRRTGSDQNSSIFDSGELKSERLGILSVIFSSCRPVWKRALTEVISLFHFVSFANETNETDH